MVKGNILGADITGTLPLPNNSGVSITGNSRSNVVGGVLAGEANLIAFNANEGITVAAAVSNTNNTFRGNSIFSNGASSFTLGIDLGADGIAANDAGDADTGANQLQNFPVLTGVTNSLSGTDVAGSLNSAANTTFILDFYSNPTPDTGGTGEGKTYLGSASVTTDGTGNTNFLVTIAATNLVARHITATATDPFGNTSEFGTNIFAFSTLPGLNLVVTNTNDSGPGSLREAIAIANTNINAGDTITFNIPGAGVQVISPGSALPTIIDPVTIDGYSQPGGSANTLTNGHNAVLLVRLDGSSAGASVDGLRINTHYSLVQGLAIGGFTSDGIEISGGSDNRIEGCYLGLDPDGTTRRGNVANGVHILSNSSGNTIGGETPAARCILSANTRGVFIVSSSFSTIKGSCIGTDASGIIARGNTNTGVYITGSTARWNVVGGTNAASRNVISGNGINFTSEGHGIILSQCLSNSILGNYIGTTADGSAALGNQDNGITLQSGASTNFIGGSLPGAGNLISGNSTGIDFSSSTSPDQVGNIVQGNLIGTDATGMVDLGNLAHGVSFGFADFNQIGGTSAGERNVISGNNGNGVNVNCCAAQSNVFEGNFIGVAANGTSPLGNSDTGVYNGSSGTRIGGTAAGAGNIIANNGDDGIIHFISSSFGVTILGNNIYSNGGLGIELGLDNAPTPNDPGDVDTGANGLQNFPVITLAAIHPTETLIEGSLNSISNRDYRIELFSSVVADSNGHGEGQVFLGFTNVTTDTSGNATFSYVHPATLVSNHVVTATATATNNTSEFSAARRAAPHDTLDLTLVSFESANLVTTTTNFTYTLFVTNNGPTNSLTAVVTNLLPATVNLVSATPTLGSVTNYGGTVVWEIGVLTNNGTASVILSVNATMNGVVSNYASISSLEIENLPANNFDFELTAVGVADVGVSHVATPNPVVAGTIITNIVTVTNRGPDTARSVSFSYSPASSMFITSANSSAGSVSIIGNSASGILGDISASNIVTVTVLTIPTEVGVYGDSFGASHSDNDPVFSNNNGNSSVTVDPGAGVFQFQQPSYAWSENVIAFAVGVFRTGGSTGTVSIDFSTHTGSATAGSDFVSTNGTLTFTNGETLKFFTVNMTDDPTAECNEVFTMSLGNPTGGGVAVLNTNATVEIFDNEVTPSGSIALASEADGGVTAGFGDSERPSISFDGRYIAFQSDLSGLVTNQTDQNFNYADVFVFDFQTRQNSLVSVNTGGVSPANSGSYEPIISRDGRHVLFYSDASDIVSGDNNSSTDIFIRHLDSNTTELITRAADGGFADASTSHDAFRSLLLSSNGNIVVFSSTAGNLATNNTNLGTEDVFARDVMAGVTHLVSADPTGNGGGDDYSIEPTVSGDGRYVAFSSPSTNLTAFTDLNAASDVFRRDLWSNVTELVSINLAGTDPGDAACYQPLMSHDGRFVTFHGSATTLVTNSSIGSQQVFQRDMVSGVTRLVSVSTNGTGADNHCELIAATPDGRFILFSTSSVNLVTNAPESSFGIFVRDMVSETTVVVNLTMSGNVSQDFAEARGLSDDGRYVTFVADGSELSGSDFNFTQDVFVRDLQLNQTTLISRNYGGVNSGDNYSYEPVLSGDGSTTAFSTFAPDITPHDLNSDPDVFVRSLSNTSNVLASVSISETANEYSFHPVISADGTRLVFASYANNLTSATGSVFDANIYLRNLTNGMLTLISVSTNGGLADNYSELPAISADNRFVLFWSMGENLVPGDSNGNGDFFLRDLLSNTIMLVGPNATNGGSAIRGTFDAKMTPDARFIVFESQSVEIAGVHPGAFDYDIFIRNRTNATAELVSVNAAGTSAGNQDSYDPVVSDDGRYVAFETFANDLVTMTDGNSDYDIVVRDRLGNSNILVSVNSAATGPGNSGSYDPIISANGRYVVFQSDATDLVTGDTNNQTDIFIRDLVMNTTALVSVKSSGAGSPNANSYSYSMTPDGRYVIFESSADDLVANDSNDSTDVFIRDTVAGTTTLISANCNGTGAGNNHSYFWDYDRQHITPDGRYVMFSTDATDLAGGDYPGTDNIMRRDLLTGTTVMVTQNRFYTGSGMYGSWEPTISTNGSVIGFASSATDLVANDLNDTDDVFGWTVAAFTPQPDLVMNKTASVGAAVQFGNLTYTLAVTNFGSASATSVSVNDVLPVGMTFVSASTSQGAVTNSGGNVTANIGTLAIGNGAAVSITVTASAAGSFTNTASATSSTADFTPANNTDSVVVIVTPLTPPTLSIQPTNSTQLLVSWPSSTPSGFVLESTTNLTPVIVWLSVTNSVSTSGTNKFVILDVNAGEPERYYRLKY